MESCGPEAVVLEVSSVSEKVSGHGLKKMTGRHMPELSKAVEECPRAQG